MNSEKKYFLLFLVSLISGYFLFCSKVKVRDVKLAKRVEKPTVKADSLITVKISAVGDLMCHSTQLVYARTGNNNFNFKPVFRLVKKYFAKSDLVMGNLETVINTADSEYSGYPSFNTPPEFLAALKYAGFNHLFLSNNHILDGGIKGLKKTVKEIVRYGFSYSGVLPEGKPVSVKIINLKGIRVSILAFTYLLNKNNYGYGKFVEKLNILNLKKRIKEARAKGADVIFVYFHFGKEYRTTPTKTEKYFARKAAEFGADIIIASHPHVVQPAEFIRSSESRLDSVFVCYSMGNFLSNQRWRYSDGGVILNFLLQKNIHTKRISFKKIGYLPVWVFKGKINSKREFLIFPRNNKNIFPNYFSRRDIRECLQSFADTDSLINNYGIRAAKETFEFQPVSNN